MEYKKKFIVLSDCGCYALGLKFEDEVNRLLDDGYVMVSMCSVGSADAICADGWAVAYLLLESETTYLNHGEGTCYTQENN